MLRIAVVGLGRRCSRHAIPYLLQNSSRWRLAALCDASSSTIERFRETFPDLGHVPSFVDLHSMISAASVDCAYIAVPHYQSASIVQQLLASKIHVLKEKPAAMNSTQLKEFQKLARSQAVVFSTASQFRNSSQLQQMRDWLPSIGKICFVEGFHKISVEDLGAGWRASRVLAGGGVVIDLGWHLVDMILNLLSDGSIPEVESARILQARPSQEYDCEDSAMAVFNVCNRKLAIGNGLFPCSISITRLGPSKTFQLTIYGEHGSLQLNQNVVKLHVAGNSENRSFGMVSGQRLLADAERADGG